MKLPFVGQSYTLRSPAAAAQQSMNVMPQAMDDPNEQGKNKAILQGVPGYHLIISIPSVSLVRGIWSGGGRLFVVGDVLSGGIYHSHLYEIGQGTYAPGNPSTGAGAVLSDNVFDTSDQGLVQMFGNGNQLGIVANGFFYCDNGAGPVLARFLLNGTITAVGAAVSWQSGDQFTADMLNQEITIGTQQLLVLAYTSAILITVSAPVGGGTGTVSSFADMVNWESGDQFVDGMAGQPIVINTLTYTVLSVLSPKVLKLTPDAQTPYQNAVPYTAVTAVLPYSSAGGDPVTAVTGAYLNSQFYVQRPVGGSPDLGRQVNFSAVNDGTSWSGLDFVTKEGDADHLQSIESDASKMFFLGSTSGEVWQNDPSTGLLVRIPGAVSRQGSAAAHAPAFVNNRLCFLGGGDVGSVVAYRLDGFTPVRISTHAEESAWASLNVLPGTANGYATIEDGHSLWVVNFGIGGTWVYDATASAEFGSPMWHQRAHWNVGGSVFDTYQLQLHTFLQEWGNAGMHIAANYSLGSADIYESSLNYPDANGSSTKWVRVIPYLYNGGKCGFVGRMTLEMATGTVATGGEPVITRDYSDDQGATFVMAQTAGIGLPGDGKRRVFWPQGGSFLDSRVYRFSGIGKVPTTLIDLEAEYTPGVV